ncbi:ABC transporter substrate-binding protein [Fundicoccus culcitae]|uniref:Extracellular solute-binding protein n=1 Tax=Fundicoccus culcitae TaxID=2969821 RepID=A0ABY5P8Y3_9LACT|nr:extracellular solute-binding protein [Fundicoccus culcitae]UUX34994.1 extracellular solute-binding protein [Fundicoccus culcitae]
MKKMLTKVAVGLSVGLLAFAALPVFTPEVSAQDRIQLRYANWNFGTEGEANIERLMIEAYNNSQDEVEVVIDQNIDTSDWTGSLATAASAGDLPDVFMLNSIPTAYTNEWLLDITDLAEADAEFAEIPQATIDATKVNDRVYALPFATHLLGYYVNHDLLNNANLQMSDNVTVDEFFDLVRSATDVNQGYVGIVQAGSIVDWYPGAMNPDFGWFTFNSTDGTFSLDSNEMAQGVNMARDLGANGFTYADQPQEVKDSLSGDDGGLAFRSGQVAFNYDGTWQNATLADQANFEWSFIGLPGDRNAIVNDFLGIAANTEYPEQAYAFAKFMSFGADGFSTRMDLTEENNLQFNTLPLTSNQENLDRYWSLVDAPGVAEAFAQLDNAMIDPLKVVPGYAQSRFEAPTGVSVGDNENANVGAIINASVNGTVNFQDYAAQLQELAQAAHDEAVQAMEAIQ